jgi:hypothetical protein
VRKKNVSLTLGHFGGGPEEEEGDREERLDAAVFGFLLCAPTDGSVSPYTPRRRLLGA